MRGIVDAEAPVSGKMLNVLLTAAGKLGRHGNGALPKRIIDSAHAGPRLFLEPRSVRNSRIAFVYTTLLYLHNSHFTTTLTTDRSGINTVAESRLPTLPQVCRYLHSTDAASPPPPINQDSSDLAIEDRRLRVSENNCT